MINLSLSFLTHDGDIVAQNFLTHDGGIVVQTFLTDDGGIVAQNFLHMMMVSWLRLFIPSW